MDAIKPQMEGAMTPVDLESNGKKNSSDMGFDGPRKNAAEEESSVAREGGEEIKYNTLEWWQAGVILIAETVSLGILSLPSVLASLGLATAVVLLIVMGILSWYSGLVLGEFRQRYPQVKSFGDAGEIMGETIGMGPAFQEFFGWAQTIFQLFVMGSHLLTWTICLNTLTDSSTCTVVWAVVGLAVFFVLSLPRTLKGVSYSSFVSFASIFTAVMVTVVDVAVERPIGSGSIEVTRHLGFTSAFLSVSNIAIAFCGHSCYFGVIAELKKPEDWPKALALLQICDTTLYLVCSIVIYVYVGPSVPSPALTAAGSNVMRKVIWGIAIPTIVIAGVIYGHIAAKYAFERLFHDTKHMTRWTVVGTASWVGLNAVVWVIAFVIAESIPVFNSLLGLVCALFASWFSYGLPGVFWLFMNRGRWFAGRRRAAATAANGFLVLVGLCLCVLGLWSSGVDIAGSHAARPWSCASNAK